MADENLPLRVAVLEQIARNTETALADIRSELRSMRSDMRSQFHWVLGIIIVVLLAQGALWYREGQMTAIGAQVNGIAADLHRLLPRQGADR